MSIESKLAKGFENLNQINQGILNNGKFEDLAEQLRKVAKIFTSYNFSLSAKVFPKLESSSDLINATEYIQNLITKKKYSEICKSIKLVKDQTILYDNTLISPKISVRVIRKSRLNLCYGKECIIQNKRHELIELINIKCCKFHYYCKPCLQNHIKTSLKNDYFRLIRCEACSKVGEVNYEDQKAIIDESEIKALIPYSELQFYYNEEIEKKFLTKCQSGLRFCPNKGNFLQKSEIIELPCGDNPCKDCYALSIIDFINEVVYTIVNYPWAYLNYNLVGIMCDYRHASSLRKCTCEELAEILNVNSVDSHSKKKIIDKYREYYEFFMGYPVEFCKSCNHICIQEDKYNTVCKKCFHCLFCFQKEHPGLTCEAFQNLYNDWGDLGERKFRSNDPSSPDRRLLIRTAQILINNKITNHKIFLYKNVRPKKQQIYLYEELIKNSSNIKSSYFFSDPFEDVEKADDLFYNDLKKLRIENFFELNLNFSNLPDSFWTIIYRVNYIGDPVEKKPEIIDVCEDPKLFIYENKCYFSKIEMALPFLILNLKKYQ